MRSRAPHGGGVCDDSIARDASLSIKTGRQGSEISPREVDDIIQETAFGAAWRHRGSKPAVCATIVKTRGIARTDIVRASLARPPARRRSDARQDVQTKFGISIPALKDAGRSNSFDEEIGGLVAA